MVLAINILIKGANAICTFLFEKGEYLWVLDVHGLGISKSLLRDNDPATIARLLRQPDASVHLLLIDPVPNGRRHFDFF